MPLFRRKVDKTIADQWFQNGDHPKDGDPDTEGEVVRYFRTPGMKDLVPCSKCGKKLHDHGWIDAGNRIVCPGDWVITLERKGRINKYYTMKSSVFETIYEEVK